MNVIYKNVELTDSEKVKVSNDQEMAQLVWKNEVGKIKLTARHKHTNAINISSAGIETI